jgi:histidyl-tRNA synthetase
MNIQTLKGFRDFLPIEARKRAFVLNALKKVFESYGFEPLETPALEYEEILTGKYGDEGEKLMYKFEDLGKRKVVLRYDQTVPLARVVAQYQNDLPTPFKRYQIQNVWRAENTQKGRFREFLQVDADIVGSYSLLSDAEIISICAKSLKELGFKKFKILVNDRDIFSTISVKEKELGIVIRSLDKLKKGGKEKVLSDLVKAGLGIERATAIIQEIEFQKPTPKILELIGVLQKEEIDEKIIEFVPTLARGLDYYTGLIFEVEIDGYDSGSIAGGGRYDNLIGTFAGKDIPAVGFSFGFDRLIEAMEELKLFPNELNNNSLLIAFASSDLQEKAMQEAQKLRKQKLNVEFYLEDSTLEKQLKYADKKGLYYVLILNSNGMVLKNMSTGDQEEVKIEQIKEKIS